jgi:hypothetical protein
MGGFKFLSFIHPSFSLSVLNTSCASVLKLNTMENTDIGKTAPACNSDLLEAKRRCEQNYLHMQDSMNVMSHNIFFKVWRKEKPLPVKKGARNGAFRVSSLLRPLIQTFKKVDPGILTKEKSPP